MRHLKYAVGAAVLCATTAHAGGIDRSGQSVSVIFEDGNYAELSLGVVAASVSGTSVAALGSRDSGDMAGNFIAFSGAYKHQFTDALSGALIIDQPYGANVDYPVSTFYYAQGSTAELVSNAVTGVLRYKLPSNVSVFGGLRYQTLSAKAFIPFVTPVPGVTPPYSANGANDGGVGYLIGAAFEKPEIALRVALTYNSEIKHMLATAETSVFGALNTTTPITTPQSVNLEIQSGIAKNTLLFGSIRWVEWSKFDISPKVYGALTSGGSLVSYDADTITYSVGVGRKFSDAFSGAVTIGYEGPTGGFASNLGPTDGFWSIGVGGTYTQDNMKITGGVRYVAIGDADTTLNKTTAAANFTGNSAIAAGVKIGFTF